MDYKAYRLALGLTQQAIADLLGTKRRTWQNWELGSRKPAPAMEKMIREKLDKMIAETP
jgi:DNA-binding transcriptional regulator YiaG